MKAIAIIIAAVIILIALTVKKMIDAAHKASQNEWGRD